MLGANTTITAGSAIFGGTVNSDATAHRSPSTAVATCCGRAVGVTSRPRQPDHGCDRTTAINGGTVRTTGNQSYGDAVTLGGNATLVSTTGGDITLTNTVSGAASDLTTDSTGTTTFSAP
jgi:hypothetical protein